MGMKPGPRPPSIAYASAFALMAGLVLLLAASTLPVGGLLGWVALAFAVLSLGYAGAGTRIFAKSPLNGRISFPHRLLLFPYLSMTSLLWVLIRVTSSETPFNDLTDGLIIGRRLSLGEYPKRVAAIVDLTAEFNEVIPLDVEYRLFASFDAAPITAATLKNIVDEISKLPSPVYLHCAQGHGRTSLVAAAVLMTADPKLTAADALKRIIDVRPRARPNGSQRSALRDFETFRLLSSKNAESG